MAYPVAPGVTSQSGIFIPEIWSSKLVEKYYDGTVLSEIANTDYEGEISNQGDKVIIRTTPSITIRDYRIGDTLQVERPLGSTIELLIDKGKYWSAIIDDIEKVQSDLDQMNMWATDASEQLKISVDSDVLANIVPDISPQNKGTNAGRISGNINLGDTGAPVALDPTNILDYILDLGQVLDEQNVPETGRFLILPFWATNMLKKSDIKAAYLTGDSTSPLRNGMVGMVDRFTIYNSNLLPQTTDTVGTNTVQAWNFIAGVKDGLTYAAQLTNTESLRAESTFGTIMRGLFVYGYKVIKPEALATLYAYKA